MGCVDEEEEEVDCCKKKDEVDVIVLIIEVDRVEKSCGMEVEVRLVSISRVLKLRFNS